MLEKSATRRYANRMIETGQLRVIQNAEPGLFATRGRSMEHLDSETWQRYFDSFLSADQAYISKNIWNIAGGVTCVQRAGNNVLARERDIPGAGQTLPPKHTLPLFQV